jgi:hypothetical protein
MVVGRYHQKYYLGNEFYKAFSQHTTKEHVQFTNINLRGRSLKMGIVHTVGFIPSWIFLICNLGEKIFKVGKAIYTDPMQNVDDSISRATERWKDNCVYDLKDLGDAAAAVIAFPFLRIALLVKDFSSAVITPEIAFKNSPGLF